MTPSGWHDDARNRDAGHDEMQIAVYDYRRSLSLEAMLGRPDNPIEGYSFCRRGIYFESPLIRDEQILAWGDIIEVWEKKEGKNPTETTYKIYEIKPKIYSVGAVVRQCVSLRLTGEKCGYYDRHSGRREQLTVLVFPVVRHDDPKLSMLQHVCPVLAWDGERLRLAWDGESRS